jgi:hypothetical protein
MTITNDDIMTQEEAAGYISEKFRPITGPELSRMTNLGEGPPFTKKGNTKIFLRPKVDSWIESQRTKEDARTHDDH